MTSHVEQIKERLSIVDVVSSYLKLEKAGINYKATCPFHNEKTPSFYVSPDRNSYYCFGCGAKGDIFTFVEQFEGIDFKGALKMLAEKAGVTLSAYTKEDTTKKDRLYQLMEAATLYYQSQLEGESKKYLTGRGLTDETIDAFRLGYAPDGWRGVTGAMQAKGFTDEEILEVGLAKRPENNEKGDLYDRFRDRLMFPIADTSGRVIAFSGRLLKDDLKQGKYINSPETPIFKKGATLYGLDKAKFAVRKEDMAVLVEGQMDLVLSHQAGFTNTVASSGTALTDTLIADTEKGLLSGLGQIHGLTKNLIVAFDADKAGMRAAARAEKIGLSLGMNVKIAKLPKGEDPADLILRDKNAWSDVLKNAQHIVLFYLEVLDEHKLSDYTRMRAIRDRILPYIALIPSAVERAHFIDQVHKYTGMPTDALTEDVNRLIDEQPVEQKKEEPKKMQAARTLRIQNRLLGILLWQEEKKEPKIDPDKLREDLASILEEKVFQEIYDAAKKRKNEYVFEVEALYKNEEKLPDEVTELVSNLEEETLATKLQILMAEIEKATDEERLQRLLQESQDITKRLNTIKSNRV